MSMKERHPTNSMIVLSSRDIEAIAAEVLRHLDMEAIVAAVLRRLEAELPNNDNAALPPDGYLRLPDILKLVPVSPAIWWRWVKAGKAPKGMKLGARMTVWDTRDIREFIVSLPSPPADVATRQPVLSARVEPGGRGDPPNRIPAEFILTVSAGENWAQLQLLKGS